MSDQPINFTELNESIDALCQKLKQSQQDYQSVQQQLLESERVRNLLVKKNQQLAAQVKQIIMELKGQMA